MSFLYYDVLSSMKISTALLEVFNGLSHHVEFPKEFIQLFIKNCIISAVKAQMLPHRVGNTKLINKEWCA